MTTQHDIKLWQDGEDKMFLEDYGRFRPLKVKIPEPKERTCINCRETSYNVYLAHWCSPKCLNNYLSNL